MILLTVLLASCPAALLGVWEYRQAAGDGFDAEGERIEITCRDGALRAVYFGLEREGEHGLFYTLVEVAQLRVAPDGGVSFTVPARELYHQRPKTPADVTAQRVTSAGVTRDELVFQGRVEDGRLTLRCTSPSTSCPDAVMVFYQGRW